MSKFIIDAIKPLFSELLDRVKAAAPGLIDAAIAWFVGWLPRSVDKLTGAFRTLYMDITARLVAWAPTTRGPLVATVDKVVAFIKTKVLAKL